MLRRARSNADWPEAGNEAGSWNETGAAPALTVTRLGRPWRMRPARGNSPFRRTRSGRHGRRLTLGPHRPPRACRPGRPRPPPGHRAEPQARRAGPLMPGQRKRVLLQPDRQVERVRNRGRGASCRRPAVVRHERGHHRRAEPERDDPAEDDDPERAAPHPRSLQEGLASSLVRESRYLREIRRLDPVADHSRIVYLDTCFEFPWDTTRSLELALFRTFAVPSIAALLDTTGEFGRAPQKRYDDTDLILSTIVEAGYDSEAGKRGDPAHEPDPRALRDLERRLPLRAVLVRLRADPLERAFRLAPADRDREAGDVRVLAGGRPADGDPGDPGPVCGARALSTRSTSGATSGGPSSQSASAARPGTCSSPGSRACRGGSARRRSTR